MALGGQGKGIRASYSPDFILEGHSGDTPLLFLKPAMDPRNFCQTIKKLEEKNIPR
jgi:hypothetical protein